MFSSGPEQTFILEQMDLQRNHQGRTKICVEVASGGVFSAQFAPFQQPSANWLAVLGISSTSHIRQPFLLHFDVEFRHHRQRRRNARRVKGNFIFFFSLASSSVAINCSLHHPGQFKQNWMLRRINSFRVNLVRSSFGLHHAETVLPSMAQSNSIARFVKSFTLSRRISLSVNIDCQNFAREICQNNTNFTKGYRSILEQLFGWSV